MKISKVILKLPKLTSITTQSPVFPSGCYSQLNKPKVAILVSQGVSWESDKSPWGLGRPHAIFLSNPVPTGTCFARLAKKMVARRTRWRSHARYQDILLLGWSQKIWGLQTVYKQPPSGRCVSPELSTTGAQFTAAPDNRPFYSCMPSDLAFEWKQGWR